MTGNRPSPRPIMPTEPELRRVTVLVADIQGSTALIQDLDAEDAAGLIDPALHAMIEAAERYDGAVSHRGDGIMAVFGAPTVAEDHGVRACLAALAMRDAIGAIGAAAGPGERVRLRVGLHSGEVVFRPVRIGGTLMQDAVGIAVHIAARLEQSAAPGTICISATAHALAAGHVRTARLEPITVKGVDVPIIRHQLLGADPAASRWAVRAARGLSAFVGRMAERATLDALLVGAGLRAAHLQAPPGFGKSRLLHEFLGGVAMQERHVIALSGDQHRQAAPFLPIANWLRGWLGIQDADDGAAARAKLAGGLAELPTLPRSTADVLRRLLGLAGTADAAIAGTALRSPADFGVAIADVMTAGASGRPIVLACEDADNFDPGTVELLDGVLRRFKSHDLLVVTTGRTRVRLPAVPASATRSIALPPLSDEDAGRLLASIDPGLAANPARAADILRKASGNPLFLEEVAALMPNREAGGREAGGREPAAPDAAGGDDAVLPAIPDRVQELIADRLGRLPVELRRIVQLCAVIGLDVKLRLIAPLSETSAADLAGFMQRLTAEQLLYESRKYPDPQYSFKHALTRDVAYGTILAARRRAHHGRIVDILEAEGEAARARNVDDLCLHALGAQLWPASFDYLQQAARQAVERAATQSALVRLRRARAVALKLPDDTGHARARLDLLMDLQAAVRWAGSYAELAPLLVEAEELAIRLDDRARQTQILAVRVHMMNILGQLDDAIALGERTRLRARAGGDANLLVSATFYAGQSYFNAGRLDDAERTLSDNLVAMTGPAANGAGVEFLLAQPSMQALQAHTLGTRAMTRALRGDFAAAFDDAAASDRLAAATGRPYDRIFAAAAGGFVALHRRDWQDAAARLRDALARSEEAEIVQLRPPALAGLGHALLIGNDVGGASETLSAAHRLARAEQRWMFQLFAAAGMALAGLRLGEPDLARRFADEAVGLAERYGFSAFHVPALRVQGLVLAVTAGQEAAGLATLGRAIAAAERLELPAEIAHGHAAFAIVRAPDAAAHRAEADRRYALLGLQHCSAAQRTALAAGYLPYL